MIEKGNIWDFVGVEGKKSIEPGDAVRSNRSHDSESYGIVIAVEGSDVTIAWARAPKKLTWVQSAARQIQEDVDREIIRDLIAAADANK